MVPTDPAELPPIDVNSLPVDAAGSDEEKAFDRDGQRLDRSLRRAAGIAALWFAAFFYLAGLMAAMHFAGLGGRFKFEGSWHIVTSVLVALFSVPTVLILAVFRATSAVKKDSDTDSLHAAIGSKVMGLLDKVIDKAVK